MASPTSIKSPFRLAAFHSRPGQDLRRSPLLHPLWGPSRKSDRIYLGWEGFAGGAIFLYLCCVLLGALGLTQKNKGRLKE